MDIDGKNIAASIRSDIREQVAALDVKPGLAVVLVGARRDSQTYVNMKTKACAQAGMHSDTHTFDDDVDQETILDLISKLNQDEAIHGILVQLPLPSHIQQETVLNAVAPEKDVDGLHPTNIAALQLYKGDALQAPFSIPCTPLGCLVLLERSQVNLTGANCVVLGRSHLVGLPMARLLLGKDATVTIAHSKTNNVQQVCRSADVLVVAVGRAQIVDREWIKPGAVVIDVGINSVDNHDPNAKKPYKLVGDVDTDSVRAVASKITPVPGGVGPMTIAMLLHNTYRACLRATQHTAEAPHSELKKNTHTE